MVKNFDKEKESKKDKKHPCKGRCTCDDCGSEKYDKKHEKGHYPRKVWPTDSEDPKHKGPKI